MSKFKNKYRIESNRWKYWDYSASGKYFLTVCIQNGKCILGKVVNSVMKLSAPGEIVKSEIEKIPTYHKRIILGEWVVMPNHFHLIIELRDYDFDNGICNVVDDANNDTNDDNDNDVEKIHEFSLRMPPTSPTLSQPPPDPQQWWYIPDYQPTIDEIKQYRKFRRKMIIPKIMGKMKMISSKQINILNNTPGKRNWQRDYYDHVIRNATSHHYISEYIQNNPRKWTADRFYRKQ